MTDIAELCRRSNQAGFEQGSLAAINLALGWLTHHGYHAVAQNLLADWDSGAIMEKQPEEPAQVTHMDLVIDPAPASPVDAAQFEPGPPKLTREQARSSGFTGNSCNDCGSLQMVRNGTCEKCNSCGATTGCS